MKSLACTMRRYKYTRGYSRSSSFFMMQLYNCKYMGRWKKSLLVAVANAFHFRFISCLALPRPFYLFVTKPICEGGFELPALPVTTRFYIQSTIFIYTAPW